MSDSSSSSSSSSATTAAPPGTNNSLNQTSSSVASPSSQVAATPVPPPTTIPTTPSTTETNAAAAIREDMIKPAVSFLSSPNVRSADREKKVAFLQKKGLSQTEITEAFKRAGVEGESAITTTATTTSTTNNVSISMYYVELFSRADFILYERFLPLSLNHNNTNNL